jgi:hypothetical protein
MGLVTEITHQALEKNSPHKAVECTYDVIDGTDGGRFLQLDSYGSKQRQVPGKKSQSLRLDANAIADLKAIIKENNL